MREKTCNRSPGSSIIKFVISCNDTIFTSVPIDQKIQHICLFIHSIV